MLVILCGYQDLIMGGETCLLTIDGGDVALLEHLHMAENKDS
jgi:hypothetical protein